MRAHLQVTTKTIIPVEMHKGAGEHGRANCAEYMRVVMELKNVECRWGVQVPGFGRSVAAYLLGELVVGDRDHPRYTI